LKKLYGILIIVLLLITAPGLTGCGQEKNSPDSASSGNITSNDTSPGNASPNGNSSGDTSSLSGTDNTGNKEANIYNIEIKIKDYGTIEAELYPDKAPATVENFINLVNDGFYNGLTFHRIIKGFMMQGGDPEGTGAGGSDNNIKGEFLANGFSNDISHVRGVLSMARSDDYDSASSQFFIMHQDDTGLDGNYAAFGMVTKGIEVVDKVCEEAEPVDGNGTIAADKQPVIESITVKE